MKQVERMRIMHAITFSRGSPGSRMSRSMAWRMRGQRATERHHPVVLLLLPDPDGTLAVAALPAALLVRNLAAWDCAGAARCFPQPNGPGGIKEVARHIPRWQTRSPAARPCA